MDSVIYLADFKAVGEFVTKPLEYYKNNLVNTLIVLSLMKKYWVNKFVFFHQQ